MRKMKVTQPEATIFRMLSGTWVTDADVASVLRCHPSQAYNRIRKIAAEHGLCCVRIETGDEESQMIVVTSRNKTTILKFVSILPP
jgi:hypothetical protein